MSKIKNKNKNRIIPIIIFVIVFVFVIGIYFLYTNINKVKYSCVDYRSNTYYEFDTEEEMHSVCDKFNGVEEDKIMDNYAIYKDLVKVNDSNFAFYPYINDDDTLSITISITNCNNPLLAKEKAEKWFIEHSYNIKDYIIEYEYPCDYTE